MFVNQFRLSGVCKRINEMMSKDAKDVQGYYLTLATIGESFGVYVPSSAVGVELLEDGAFLEVSGELKTKAVVNKDNRTSSVSALSVTHVALCDSPFRS